LYLSIGLSFLIVYLSTRTKKIHSPIKTTKRITSISGMVTWAIRAMGWSVVTNAKVFALVGVFGDARKGFIF